MKEKSIYGKLTILAKLVRLLSFKGWAKFELECVPLKLIYSDSFIVVICKNADFECRYINTHAKENPYF